MLNFLIEDTNVEHTLLIAVAEYPKWQLKEGRHCSGSQLNEMITDDPGGKGKATGTCGNWSHVSTVRKQRQMNALLLSVQFGSTTHGRLPPAFREALSSSLNLVVTSQVCPEVGLLGDSRPVKVTVLTVSELFGEFVICDKQLGHYIQNKKVN